MIVSSYMSRVRGYIFKRLCAKLPNDNNTNAKEKSATIAKNARIAPETYDSTVIKRRTYPKIIDRYILTVITTAEEVICFGIPKDTSGDDPNPLF